jgi:hypothetical protein
MTVSLLESISSIIFYLLNSLLIKSIVIGTCTRGTKCVKGKWVAIWDLGIVPFSPKFCGMKTNRATCIGADCVTLRGLECKACLSKLASLMISSLRLWISF